LKVRRKKRPVKKKMELILLTFRMFSRDVRNLKRVPFVYRVSRIVVILKREIAAGTLEGLAREL